MENNDDTAPEPIRLRSLSAPELEGEEEKDQEDLPEGADLTSQVEPQPSIALSAVHSMRVFGGVIRFISPAGPPQGDGYEPAHLIDVQLILDGKVVEIQLNQKMIRALSAMCRNVIKDGDRAWGTDGW